MCYITIIMTHVMSRWTESRIERSLSPRVFWRSPHSGKRPGHPSWQLTSRAQPQWLPRQIARRNETSQCPVFRLGVIFVVIIKLFAWETFFTPIMVYFRPYRVYIRNYFALLDYFPEMLRSAGLSKHEAHPIGKCYEPQIVTHTSHRVISYANLETKNQG